MASLIIIAIVFSLPYVYFTSRLWKHLEKWHPKELEKLDLPKKVKFGFYYHTPKTQLNALKFILSKEDFGDEKLKFFKRGVQVTLIILIIGWIFLALGITAIPRPPLN